MELDVGEAIALLERYGYLFIFLAGFAEGLPFIGMLIPGQMVVLLGGGLAATGHLKFWLVVAAAFPAGVLGDAVGYYLGRVYGRAFLERYGHRLRISDAHLNRSDELFKKYGPLALVFARFSFLTRGIGPVLAGISKMRQRTFWTFNFLGALVWAFAYSAVGFFFGAAFLRLEGAIGRILTVTLAGVLGLYFLYRMLKKYAKHFTRVDFYIALAGIVGGTAFGIVADRLDKLGPANRMDAVEGALRIMLAPAKPFLRILEALASDILAGIAAIALVAYLAWRGRRWEAALAGMGVGGILMLAGTLRPTFQLVYAPEFARATFPSVHAAVALVFAGVAAYLARAHARDRWLRITAPIVAIVVVGGMSVASFARGLEHLSDVIGGLALGLAWLSVSILVVEFGLKR